MAHARREAGWFLALSQEIRGRNSKCVAALGVLRRLRHAVPELLKTSGLLG